MAELVLSSGDTPVLRAPMHGQAITVGRSLVNDISIPDDDLPPFLCALEPIAGGGGYRVVDKSGKGIVVNGKKVHDDVLPNGAELVFGRLRARFVRGAADGPGKDAGQRTGILKTRSDGKLIKSEIHLRLPGANAKRFPPRACASGPSPTTTSSSTTASSAPTTPSCSCAASACLCGTSTPPTAPSSATCASSRPRCP